MLTQEIPFPANFRKTGIPLPPPKQFNDKISDRVNDAILAGMALEPSRRPQTVREWLELFIPFIDEPTPDLVEKENSQEDLEPTIFTSASGGIGIRESQNSFASKNSFVFESVNLTIVGKGKPSIKRHVGKAEFFKEHLNNGVVLEMVKIPGGLFMMGSPENEGENSERPQHQVTVPAFFMAKFPTTQEEYQAVMGSNPSRFNGAKRPVESVIWNNAVNFCTKISVHTGKSYRLPTEAEWEYACRAGTITPFHFGETITTDLANYNGNYVYASTFKGRYREQTTDVGSFPANNFGLYDMHGLVWEWCQDKRHDNYDGAPIDGSAWLDSYASYDNEYSQILRGGSWNNNPGLCRSTYRNWNHPGNDLSTLGFRVVCDI